MTLPPERIGDKGQRYETRVEGYPKDGWNVIGWSPDEDGAIKMAKALRSAPGAKGWRVWDRTDEAFTAAGTFGKVTISI